MPRETPDAPARAWGRVTLVVPSALEDEVLARFGGDALGVEVGEGPGDTSLVGIVVESPGAAGTLREAAEAWLAGREGSVRAERVDDGRWVERYQAALRPFDLGRRFVVHPGGAVAGPASSRSPLILVPGRAFGTGEHATTRLCVGFLEDRVRPGSRWLDLGCGSGVLALVAARLGASSVLAVDVDPEAIDVAREVLAVNGAPDAVRLAVGSIDEAARLDDGPLDGIVANIQSSFFREGSRALADRLGGAGRLIVSGVLVEERAELERTFAGHGLAIDEERTEAPWAAWELLPRRGAAR